MARLRLLQLLVVGCLAIKGVSLDKPSLLQLLELEPLVIKALVLLAVVDSLDKHSQQPVLGEDF